MPVVILVDEAQAITSDQELPDGRKISTLLIGLHKGEHGLKLLPVFAGLADTRAAMARLGISRLGDGAEQGLMPP